MDLATQGETALEEQALDREESQDDCRSRRRNGRVVGILEVITGGMRVMVTLSVGVLGRIVAVGVVVTMPVVVVTVPMAGRRSEDELARPILEAVLVKNEVQRQQKLLHHEAQGRDPCQQGASCSLRCSSLRLHG